MLDIVFLVVKKLNSKFPQEVVGLYITGSTARKEAEEYSDLDVVAIVDGDLDPQEISKIFDGDVQVNVFKRGELRREVKEDPTIALMIKEGIPIKPLSNIDEDLSFTREDILKAISRTARELLQLLKRSGAVDSGVFLALMYARKLYTLRCMLLEKTATKQGFIGELKEYYSGIEEIYRLKKRIEKGEIVELNEDEFKRFLRAVVDYAIDVLGTLR